MGWKDALAWNRYALTESTAAELAAQQQRDWARHQREAKARLAAARQALDTRLEVSAAGLDTYARLGRAASTITTEQMWCDLYDEVGRLVDTRELSSRHGRELRDRLVRIARDRRWVQD